MGDTAAKILILYILTSLISGMKNLAGERVSYGGSGELNAKGRKRRVPVAALRSRGKIFTPIKLRIDDGN